MRTASRYLGLLAALAATARLAGAAAPARAPERTATTVEGVPSARPPHFRLVGVAPGAWAAIAVDGDRASVGNAGFVVGSTGVLVVDAFATEEAARDLLAEIRRTTPFPVRWVVDTHYHLDHMGGNSVFRDAGAVVIGDENVRRWARTENLKWRREITDADRAARAALVLPEVTMGAGGRITLDLGDRTAEILARPGHTGGDVIVRVAEGNVVFAGDLFWKSTVPNLIDADTRAWVETLDGILRNYPAAAFVPGHGEPGHALDVRFFRDYLFAVRQTVAREIDRGTSGQALVDAAVDVLRPRYGAWTWFAAFAAAGIAQTEQEMRGQKSTATHFQLKPKELP